MLYLSPVLPLDFLSSHSPIFSLLFVFLIALVDLVVGANRHLFTYIVLGDRWIQEIS